MKKRNPAVLAPLLPLTFIVGYMYDMGYGSKLERMKGKGREVFMHACRSDNNQIHVITYTCVCVSLMLATFSLLPQMKLTESWIMKKPC